MTHNSVFVIAHFHCVVMVTVFAAVGGATFWFPKMFGFTLHERSGQWVFWLLVGGSFFVFTAMFLLGLTGMPRRLAYVPYAGWWPLLVIEEIGIFVDIAALVAFVWQITVSIRDRNLNRATRDPWGTARSLEWITHSPVPVYNFAVIPHVNARDEWAWRREHHLEHIMPERYADIELPVNTPVPMLIGACTAAFGFAMVWRIWWLAIALAGRDLRDRNSPFFHQRRPHHHPGRRYPPHGRPGRCARRVARAQGWSPARSRPSGQERRNEQL